MSNQEEEKIVQPQVYSYDDLLQFQNHQLYSSIGKMTNSKKPTAPSYGFGTADRKKQAKVFQSKELCKTQFHSTASPGPNYEVRHTDKFYYEDQPTWSFGKDIRNTLNTGAKHAYYNRQDVDFDPMGADITRRWHLGAVKIGLESRFSDAPSKTKGTPGPEYDPCFKPDAVAPPKYSMGVRRTIKGESVLVLPVSTPYQVGPGSYLRLNQGNTSTMPDHPKVSFTKDPKHKLSATYQKNQTYDTRSSMGDQIATQKRSMPIISIGKAKRDNRAGTFRSHMSTQTTRVRIQLPKF
jgi:hypothetical protein